MNDNIMTALLGARKFIEEASVYGLDLPDSLNKIRKAIELLNADTVSLVLLGSFADGKTTVVAGLIGELMDDMKIDANESSDEIVVYKADFLDKKFVFVDTPGLFGSREKVTEGGKVKKFSSITEDYISQANVIMYVTDASNPLPESHQSTLRHIMCDLRKLDNAIFVINKMDQKYDTLDEFEFKEGTDIKTSNLRERLQRCLGLSQKDADNLTIVCIAANPKGKGLPYWFADMGAYQKRSHINLLENAVKNMVANVDSEKINVKTALDTAIDAMDLLDESLFEAKKPINQAIAKAQPILADLNDKLELTAKNINNDKLAMIESLDSLEQDVKGAVNAASLETIGEVLTNYIGCGSESIDFSILTRRIEAVISHCSNSINTTIQRASVDVIEGVTLTETLVNDAIAKGAGFLKNAKITPEMVGKIRDMFFKNFKFKPYGKINMAAKLTKWVGRFAMALSVGMEVYDWYKTHKQQKEFRKAKQDLLKAITDIFNQAHSLYRDEDTFISNFAPAIVELRTIIQQRDAEIADLRERLDQMEARRAEVREWKSRYIEDVQFDNL